MKNFFRNLMIVSLVLSLTCANAVAAAMPDPTPATQTDKQKAAAARQKEAEKRKKEAAKQKAAREKQKAADAKKREAEKKKAAAAKQSAQKKEAAAKESAQKKEAAAKESAQKRETAAKESAQKREATAKQNAQKQAARDKAAAERAKQAQEREAAAAKREAETRAREQQQLRDWKKQEELKANPKPEVISYFNLGLRLGYAAMMDKFNNEYMGAGTLNQSNALQQLKGGPGAGLTLGYNLEYGHFLFETGLDFRYLNSTSAYGFQAQRIDANYSATYNYLFDNVRETRNMMQLGIPVMFGAQFSRYYFLLGAKIGYSIWGNYSQKGKYDIVVKDNALIDPYGMGIHELNGQTKTAIKFAQPEVSLAAEVGIDLDEWLQAQPDKRRRQARLKPGQRLPFGKEHIHYRVGLFAEYGVLNTNATPKANPVEFATDQVPVQNSNTLLAYNGNTKLNNLFVGAKFTVQFEVPGKKERPIAPPPSYAIYTVKDANTGADIPVAFIQVQNTETGKITMREKRVTTSNARLRNALGTYEATVRVDGYRTATQRFTIDEVGSTNYVTVSLTPRPVFRIRVTNSESGEPIPATVVIRRNGQEDPAYTLATDSTSGAAKQMMDEGFDYTLAIAQMGYDAVERPIHFVGDSMNIALNPIKKGEVFIVHNLFFATNKTRILAISEQALQDLYMYLERNPEVRIKIIGHTDNVGKDAANQKLSEGRAKAVREDLMERGIAPERIESEGRGESQPIDTNDTEEGRQNNRRVEIEIL